MATPKYDALVAKVRDWSNRDDSNALPDSVLKDCLNYGADEAYRELRIPPLEFTLRYPAVTEAQAQAGDGAFAFTLPPAFTEMIQVRVIRQDSDGNVLREGYVFDNRVDVRTFEGIYTEKPSGRYWTRKGDNILVYPSLSENEILEIHYYRRLGGLDANFLVNAENYNLGAFTDGHEIGSTNGYLTVASSTDEGAEPLTILIDDVETTVYFTGNEAPNWLRDNQEKVLIFGALVNLATYLNDTEMGGVNQARFTNEIQRLNNAEAQRMGHGGNPLQTFQTNHLI